MHYQQCHEISSLHIIQQIRGSIEDIFFLFVTITSKCTDTEHLIRFSFLPGLMKSDKPKSVAFREESSLADLKRKFYI